MKRSAVVILAAALLLCALFSGCGKGETLTLNVYNWGEYIADGSEGSFDTVRNSRNGTRRSTARRSR